MRVHTVSPEARAAVLAWYDARGRTLPFRGQLDPYAILVSEVMAQQTQISRVSEQWATFMAAFPSVESLAEAPTADVLRAWRGLGYNRRALNLQRAARVIVSEHGGRVPSNLDELLRLPGVGPYTARAVAALAFGQAVGPVDTNVRRVLARLMGADATTERARSPIDCRWVRASGSAGGLDARVDGPWRDGLPPERAALRRMSRRAMVSLGEAGPRAERRAGLPPAAPSRRPADGCADESSISCGTCPTTNGEPLRPRSASTKTGPSARRLLAMESEGLIERDRSDPERVRLAR